MKSIVAFFILLQIAFSFQSQVTVSVFYETMCKDSIAFITEQLVPTWNYFGGAGNSVFVIDYIPYGKANEELGPDGVSIIRCHHGPLECQRNKEHACGIKYLPKREITPFINCSMLQNTEVCTESEKLEKIEKCVNESEGHQLMVAYGERTSNLKPILTSVPWILFDGVYSLADMEDSQKNLTRVICRKTKACSDNSESTSKSTLLKPSLSISILTIVFTLKMH